MAVDSKPQQSSLHSFWAIPSMRQSSPASNCSSISRVSAVSSSTNNSLFLASNCEDCDASLNPEADSMDVDMMDIDVSSNGGNHSCSRCGKQVCRNCAVSNLGTERKCLNCAGRAQKWAGGIGFIWVGPDSFMYRFWGLIYHGTWVSRRLGGNRLVND